MRYDRARSERRLCIAVKTWAEVAATPAIRVSTCRRLHELQAPTANMMTTTALSVAITVLRIALTESRSSMVLSQPFCIAAAYATATCRALTTQTRDGTRRLERQRREAKSP